MAGVFIVFDVPAQGDIHCRHSGPTLKRGGDPTPSGEGMGKGNLSLYDPKQDNPEAT